MKNHVNRFNFTCLFSHKLQKHTWAQLPFNALYAHDRVVVFSLFFVGRKAMVIFMNKYKVAVYAICKNEENFVDRWMDSMSEADAIYVADTGSSDGTVKKLQDRGAIVNEIRVVPWRFDEARNISMSFIPEDFDICVCTDLDEVFENGWRTLLENAWTEHTTRLSYMFTWSFNDDGTPGVTFWQEKTHARDGFQWVHPVHEVLKYSGKRPDVYAKEGRIHLNHYPDKTKSRGQYLELLELSVQESPDDDRNMHYLGREYMFYKNWNKCIETLKKHLSLPTATWKDERSASMRYIARAYRAKNNMQEARRWLYRAISETPYLREPYVEMARLAYAQNDWTGVIHMAEEALKIKERPQSYINEGFCWDHTIYDLAAIAFYNLGLYENALNFAQTAAEMSPQNERLQKNLEIIKAKTE